MNTGAPHHHRFFRVNVSSRTSRSGAIAPRMPQVKSDRRLLKVASFKMLVASSTTKKDRNGW